MQDSPLHRFAVRVFYEDTDMAGIVYHANYLKYIERARSDWVAEQGIDQNVLRAEGHVFVVRRIVADYHAPARLDDRLEVHTHLAASGPVRLVLRQTVLNADRTLFEAEVTVVCATLEGRPARLPPVLRSLGDQSARGAP